MYYRVYRMERGSKVTQCLGKKEFLTLKEAEYVARTNSKYLIERAERR